MRHHIISTFLLTVFFSFTTNAQVFSGFNAFKKIIEFEGQRFLMEEIYDVGSEAADELVIEQTIKEYDADEGFMFVLTSYMFNSKTGVVITALNSRSFANNKFEFVNLHMSSEEFKRLNNAISSVEVDTWKNKHYLKKFNSRVIIDIGVVDEDITYTLWIDYNSRHTFQQTKWQKTFKKHLEFIGEK